MEIFTPVINLPQSAILGVNTIVPRPKDLGDGVYGFVPYIAYLPNSRVTLLDLDGHW